MSMAMGPDFAPDLADVAWDKARALEQRVAELESMVDALAHLHDLGPVHGPPEPPRNLFRPGWHNVEPREEPS